MIDSLITSKTRIKLLLKFFLNSETKSYLRSLETEFGESTNSIRVELNRFEQSGLLISVAERNKKLFSANTSHPLFNDINSILRKFVGIDKIIDQIISKAGDIHAAYLAGELANGKDSPVIDLIIVGNQLRREYIDSLVTTAERTISRKINYTILPEEQKNEVSTFKPTLLIWGKE